MEVFISWSGPAAKAVANELHEWLPTVHQQVTPWVSDKDIAAGSVWREEIRKALGRAVYSIICVTQEGLRSPWVHFEAGAIHAGFQKPVCPYLIGVDQAAMAGLPIEQLQWVQANLDGTKKLLNAINMAAERPLQTKILDRAVDGQWSSIEKVIAENSTLVVAAEDPQPVRSMPVGDDGDAVNMLVAWLGGLSIAQERDVVVFADVDRRFGFPPGTTHRLFDRAATEAKYTLEGATANTVRLKRLPVTRGSFSVPTRPRRID
jgi:hypothetical protein